MPEWIVPLRAEGYAEVAVEADTPWSAIVLAAELIDDVAEVTWHCDFPVESGGGE